MSALSLLLFALPAIAAAQAPPGPTGQAAPGAPYRIGPRDLVQIEVLEVPELNIERRVGADGSVDVPRLGPVAAQGLTETELAERLKRMLEERFLRRASVTVRVQEFRYRPISVIGAVQQPGELQFSGRWTLLEAITAAGGLASGHAGSVHVLRRAGNGLSDQVVIPIEGLISRADPNLNIPIYPNDLINVPAAVQVTVYCLGEVATPGAITFDSNQRITLLTAVARAGGLTDRASKKIRIRRQLAGGGEEEIVVDFKRILDGREPDPQLQSGDVVVVKESFF